MKIVFDTRYGMNEEEKREYLKCKCPVCGKENEPYMYIDGMFKTKYSYKCFNSSDMSLLFTTGEVKTIKGCESEWYVKVSQKEFIKKCDKNNKSLVMRIYIKILKKLAGR